MGPECIKQAYKEYKFHKEVVRSRVKFSPMINFQFDIFDIEDQINTELFRQIDAFFYSRKSEKIFIEQTFERPTFFDWLFRKRRTLSVEIVGSDLLVDPPEYNCESIRTYEYKKI